MYKIVTISREFGCNARGIAQKKPYFEPFKKLSSRFLEIITKRHSLICALHNKIYGILFTQWSYIDI